jgi:hypothetical protein
VGGSVDEFLSRSIDLELGRDRLESFELYGPGSLESLSVEVDDNPERHVLVATVAIIDEVDPDSVRTGIGLGEPHPFGLLSNPL